MATPPWFTPSLPCTGPVVADALAAGAARAAAVAKRLALPVDVPPSPPRSPPSLPPPLHLAPYVECAPTVPGAALEAAFGPAPRLTVDPVTPPPWTATRRVARALALVTDVDDVCELDAEVGVRSEVSFCLGDEAAGWWPEKNNNNTTSLFLPAPPHRPL